MNTRKKGYRGTVVENGQDVDDKIIEKEEWLILDIYEKGVLLVLTGEASKSNLKQLIHNDQKQWMNMH